MASTFAISIGAAFAGEGLAMAHDGLVADALADGRLVRPFDTMVPMSECYALYQPAQHMRSWASRALTDWLVAEFADPAVCAMLSDVPAGATAAGTETTGITTAGTAATGTAPPGTAATGTVPFVTLGSGK